MSRTVRLIQGKGDWEATPPTGASDADLSHIANDFIVQAGVVDLEGGDALVTELDTPSTGVQVAKGTIYVENSSWIPNSNEPRFYQVVGDEIEELEVSTNSSGDERIDLIAQKIDKITPPNDEATNVGPLVVIEGTPGAGEPSVPANHEVIAALNLPDGYDTVDNSMIEDRRRQTYLETKDINGGFTEIADTPNITIDLSTTRIRKFRIGPLAGNRNFTLDNAKEGEAVYVVFINDGTARSPSWQNVLKWFGIENDPAMADYVDPSKEGAFMFVCTDEDNQEYDAFFLGSEQ